MKKLLLILLCLPMIGFGQITTKKVADRNNDYLFTPYDSTLNFLKDNYKGYIGQKLYTKGKSETLRDGSYDRFYKDYTKNLDSKSNRYKCCDKYYSKYNELVGKYFVVLDAFEYSKGNEANVFLKLKEEEGGDIVYYKYDTKYYFYFDFIVAGYFLKQKEINLDKEFIIRGRNWISKEKPMIDMNTGKKVDFSAGSKWKCIDITIDEKYYYLSLILENSISEQIFIDLIYLNHEHYIFSLDNANKYKKKFGEEKWSEIIEGKINIGFTEEMVLIAFGKPKKIKKSTDSDQWVYDNQFLYFEDGILTHFN
ncbi:hypothetical protein OAX10_01735 [Flavobacteriales bacterium]|nr:hypothetical protein [Flavobacteriales bacterium]